MIEFLIPAAAMFAGLSPTMLQIALRASERRRTRQVWLAACEEAGLRGLQQTGGFLETFTVTGFSTTLTVRLTSPMPQQTRIAVWCPHPLALVVRSAGPRAGDIEVGDPLFDDTFFVDGNPLQVLALLDQTARRLLLGLEAEGHVSVQSNELSLRVFDRALDLRRALPRLLESCLETAGHLSQPTDAVRRLADNARQDREHGVRMKCLLMLMREFPEHEAVAEALRAALQDSSPEMRLRAATALGAEGRDVLRELMAGPRDSVAAHAVAALGRGLETRELKAVLDQSLRGLHNETAKACLDSLGRRAEPESLAAVAKVLSIGGRELATAAAAALGASGSPLAEAALIAALLRTEDEVRTAAACALENVGSPAAVLPLQEAVARHGDAGLRAAVRQAIAAIQARAGGSPGQISMSAAEAGQLSLPEAEAGQVSLAPTHDAEGRLSMTRRESKED
jgi:HEAT repeat protein